VMKRESCTISSVFCAKARAPSRFLVQLQLQASIAVLSFWRSQGLSLQFFRILHSRQRCEPHEVAVYFFYLDNRLDTWTG
jgi:hypothetical protein